MDEHRIYLDKVIQEDQAYKDYKEILNDTDLEFHALSKPLLIEDTTICEGYGIAIISKGKKIVFVQNNDVTVENFEDFIFNFKQLIFELIGKYEYRSVLGTARQLNSDEDLFFECTLSNFKDIINSDEIIATVEKKNKLEVISSLIKGSVNEIGKIETVLGNSDFIKRSKNRIISFDANQTRFIFPSENFGERKRFVVQGIAGSGKTEMLLHRLRTLYIEKMAESTSPLISESTDSGFKIAFTCHNKVLAKELRETRVNKFFDSMKVNFQIKWDEYLYCFSTWGSSYNKNSGLYAYICHYYNIQFYNLSSIGDFDSACKKAIEDIKKYDTEKYAFDYILIDESQDLPDTFFELCELVTKESIYVAGDVYQDIFDTQSSINFNPDFLLNRVYRTDSKTFLFSHLFALGYFDNLIRWLDDDTLKLCGYNYTIDKDFYNISRDSYDLLSEETEGDPYKCVVSSIDQSMDLVVDEIENLYNEYSEDIVPEDIAIVILCEYKEFERNSLKISNKISDKLNISSKISTDDTKIKDNCIYISNQNKVKGLEFPFVFVIYDDKNIDPKSKKFIKLRTAFYMAATRSFLKSFMYIAPNNNIDELQDVSNAILQEGCYKIKKPSQEEIDILEEEYNTIVYSSNKLPLRNIVEAIVDEVLIGVSPEQATKEKIIEDIVNLVNEKQIPEDEYTSFIKNKAETFRVAYYE